MAELYAFNPSLLLEQVRRRLQRTLGARIVTRPANLTSAGGECYFWQVGLAIRFLVIYLPTPDGVGWLPTQPWPADCYPLVVGECIHPALRTKLQAQNIYYADALGNVWVNHPAVKLQSVAAEAYPASAAALSPSLQVEQMRLLFQILKDPVLATYSCTELATHTGLAKKIVARVLGSMPLSGLNLQDLPYCPTKQRELVSYWISHYGKALRNRLNATRYRWRDAVAQANWRKRVLPAGCWWSGEAAAHQLLGKSSLPGSFALYSHLPRVELADYLGLVAHTGGRVEILNAFFPATSEFASRCAPPLLVYADLVAGHSPMCAELAQQLRSRYLPHLL